MSLLVPTQWEEGKLGRYSESGKRGCVFFCGLLRFFVAQAEKMITIIV